MTGQKSAEVDATALRASQAVFRAFSQRPPALQAIWLFGSRARALARPDSDVDVAILCAERTGPDLLSLQDELSSREGLELDLIDLRSAPPELAWEVITTGRLLIEIDEIATEQFVRAARFAVEDAEQRNRMMLLAQVDHLGGSTR